MWPCRVKEKMTLKEVDGQTVEEIETKIIDKDDTITRVPEKFQGGLASMITWIIVDALHKMAPSHRSGNNDNNNNENPDIAAIITQQLQNILPQACQLQSTNLVNPKEYDGKGGAIVLTRWIEKMENVIDNSGCAENQKVRYAASSLVNKALTWWNTQVQARGREAAMAMTWNDFKALMVKEFCPRMKWKIGE
ncbi:hypothetical protein Tco_0832521 [Tanacetum coccineum]